MKIQFDTVTGVCEVLEFEETAIIIEGFDIADLKNAEDGKVYAAEIDDLQFNQIKSEYGINLLNLQNELHVEYCPGLK